MTEKEKQFNQWFDEYADGVKVFEEADMKQAYLQGRADLEKENKVLAQNLEDTEILNKTYEKKHNDLKKENAELKHTIATLRQEKDNVSMHAKAMEIVVKTRSDQLTKAKEIIKDLLGSENTSCEEEMFFEIRQKAEQFIKDSEVEE